jgi:hypothetical protein
MAAKVISNANQKVELKDNYNIVPGARVSTQRQTSMVIDFDPQGQAAVALGCLRKVAPTGCWPPATPSQEQKMVQQWIRTLGGMG